MGQEKLYDELKKILNEDALYVKLRKRFYEEKWNPFKESKWVKNKRLNGG